jgi:predicted nucleotide-binding protein (sugar kinase/HSP70/actin superfamily)
VTDVTTKAVYLPHMAEHALAVAGAMRHYGIRAEVLPPPNAESMAIGLDLCRGRECLPCFLCTGDMIRETRKPGFDPQQAIFFMPTGPGPCRFGQYRILERDILDRLGLGAIEVVSPDAAASYALFGANPSELRKQAWQGIVAVDLLMKLLHEHRPYESRKGASDEAHMRSLARVVAAAEAGGGACMVEAMGSAARDFAKVAIDRSVERPLIGVVGELFVMLNTYSNGGLIREVEAAGGEVLQSTFMDWLHFTAWSRRTQDWLIGDYKDWLDAFVVGFYQRHIEHKLRRAVAARLRHPEEAPMPEIMKALTPFYDPALGTEGVVTMGRAINYARSGVSGILNVLPFSCMPGIIAGAMAPRLREPFGGIPWLDLSYDGQEETNIRTRLEAFMHQAFQFSTSARRRRQTVRP